jgi:group I intron endonuclease
MVVYKVTNLINNKIYIGQDTNNNPNYYGSGLIIKKALKKYGKENFKKEILEECFDQKELDEKEVYWIKILNSLVPFGYNLQEGGKGGKHHELTIERMRESRFKWLEENESYKHDEEIKQYLSELKIEYYKENIHYFQDKKFTDEHIQKLKDNHADVSGEKNPMFEKSVLEVWIEKYGEKEALQQWEQRNKKVSNSLKGKNRPDISKRTKGENNPFYGKTHSKDFKEKLSKLRSKPVLQLDLEGNFIKEWESLKSLKENGFYVSDCCKGKRDNKYGFIWKYK